MDEEDGVHRLEGTSGNEKGGLIVTKKKEPTFKVPKPSLLGLDRLAAQKRKEKEDAARKMSFSMDDEGPSESPARPSQGSTSKSKDERKFRSAAEETPTYTGGVTKEAQERLRERERDRYKEKGVYATTKDRYKHEKRRDRARDDRRSRDRYKERSSRSERHGDSSRRHETPRFRDEPKTPDYRVKDAVAKTSWDEDDDYVPSKRSMWDYPTPKVYKKDDEEWSERSSRPRHENETSWRNWKASRNAVDESERATPAHRYNAWMKDRRKTGATPNVEKEQGNVKWDATEERENWEEEQKRLDREWYNMDEGYDDENNPFSTVSDEYTKKKEEQLEQRKKKRLSAQQRQINKDNELWERNRMLTSGVVHSVDYNEDFDEESVDRVHLLVHNIVPPFLDGRIVFTKQPEPVIPVKDPTSDMALVARKGSHLVRVYREQKERKKAQKKHWELGGTKIGNIMGIKKKEDEDDVKYNKENDSTDYKTDHKFAEHMKGNSEASSEFAKRKSISEQRRYLPVFAVRQELLNVIRENNIVIIVGMYFFRIVS